MNSGFFSNGRTAVPQQPGPHGDPHYAVPNAGGGHGFLIFSALVHIAVVVLLMHSWSGGLSLAKAETRTPSSAPEQPATPRLSIDIAPMQYCEMDIEKIVGRPRVSQPRVESSR
jgi:hypothetical protein